MADRKITDLTALTTPASADVLPIVDVSEAAAADKNKKVTVGELFKGIPDGTAAAPAIAFESDDGNGFFLSTTDTIGIATNGVSRATVSTTVVTSTLPVIVPDGSAAAPSVAFTGSGTDTGLYSPGADQVAISTNGTGRLFINSSGQVGVGTSSPASKLTIAGTQGNFRVDPDSVANEVQLLTTVPDNSGFRNYRIRSNQLFLDTSGSTALTIDTSQRVGVGTTSPSDLLHIAGAYGAGTARFEDTANTNSIGKVFGYAGGLYLQSRNNTNYGEIVFRGENSGGTAERMRIDSSGRVGIGVSSPSELLHLGSGGKIRLNRADNATGSTINDGGSNNGIVFNSLNNDGFTFQNGGTTVFKIDTATNGSRVGIGSTPDVTLHVATGNATGYVKIDGGTSSSATNGLLFRSGSNTYSAEVSHYQSNLSLYTAGSERARIDSSGNFAFNSGYGSVATAYGCRAWVNFNGTGTVAIRASGNVSSITDNGLGRFAVNFTISMPDSNYAAVCSGGSSGINAGMGYMYSPATGGTGVEFADPSSALMDPVYATCAVFR